MCCHLIKVLLVDLKLFYQHSELINKFGINNISSQILHLKKKKLSKLALSFKKRVFSKSSKKYGWFANEMKAVSSFIPSSSWVKNKILIKNDMNFDPDTDFVIMPEIWAHFASDFLVKQKIKYSNICPRILSYEFILRSQKTLKILR